jgi:hypothetical protein
MTRTPQNSRSRRRRKRLTLVSPSVAQKIRWSKVMLAQARLASGYYDRPDVGELVVHALWRELQRD